VRQKLQLSPGLRILYLLVGERPPERLT